MIQTPGPKFLPSATDLTLPRPRGVGEWALLSVLSLPVLMLAAVTAYVWATEIAKLVR